MTVDHFLPESAGGTNDDENLVTACVSCNNMKSDRPFPSLAAARAEIGQWIRSGHAYWERNVNLPER